MGAVPESFGKYFLTEKIADGGMAEIYLAKLLGPDGFEKFLIIKKIHPELSKQRQFVEMFVAEAKTLVSLSHGNIVPIYELGMVDSSYFIAMEYIDGPTLDALVNSLRKQRQSIAVTMAAHISAELLKGLDYAHRKGEGVIHRDLSPRNVMISREGEVKLVDFGIAVPRTDSSQSLLESNLPSGSFPHMSPEQAAGETLDPRSDLFAMGILLWEMITGRSLFARDTDEATLEAVQSAVIDPPSDYCPDCDAVLDAICAKALERDRGLRYKSADEFLVAINRYLYSQTETVSPQKVSELVARHCPPTVSEFTRPREVPSKKKERAGTAPFERGDRLPMPRKRSGTVPLENPSGKRRAETVRTFATNVNFKQTYDADPAPADENEEPGEAALSTTGDSAEEAPGQAEITEDNSREEAKKVPPKLVNAQSSNANKRRLFPLLAIALLLGGALLTIVWLGKENTQAASIADAGNTARPIPFDASVAPSLSDARAVAEPVADATALVIVDARKRIVPKVRRSDARTKVVVVPGSIRIGANPWADVYVDGKRVGRAPGSFSLSAGTHTIELRFRDKSKTLQVKVKAGELTRLGVVDFLAED